MNNTKLPDHQVIELRGVCSTVPPSRIQLVSITSADLFRFLQLLEDTFQDTSGSKRLVLRKQLRPPEGS